MRPPRILPCLCALACAFAARGADAPAGDAPGSEMMEMELYDGSRLFGTPDIGRFKMTTQYAEVEIPISRVQAITFGDPGHSARIDFENGDQLSGKPAVADIKLKTIFGRVVVPLAQVSSIAVAHLDKIMEAGLVLHYTFDAVNGGRVADESDSGSDGLVHGAVFTSKGKVNGAMSFNGDRQAVIVGNPTSLQLQNFTIMAWVKLADVDNPSKGGQDGVVFGYGQGGYGMGIRKGGHLYLTRTNFDAVVAKFEIHDTAFHHLAVTKQEGKVVFYLDGVAYPAGDYGSVFEFETEAAVGAVADTLTNGFNGVIDEVKVFNRALPDGDIKRVYDSQK